MDPIWCWTLKMLCQRQQYWTVDWHHQSWDQVGVWCLTQDLDLWWLSESTINKACLRPQCLRKKDLAGLKDLMQKMFFIKCKKRNCLPCSEERKISITQAVTFGVQQFWTASTYLSWLIPGKQHTGLIKGKGEFDIHGFQLTMLNILNNNILAVMQ